MSKLIDKQKALEKLWELDSFVDFEGMAVTRASINLIENMPVVEIIHCRDCKFYTPMNRELKMGICSITMHHLGDNGFCSDAEKR